MVGFHQAISNRVADVERHLDEAKQAGDDYLVEIRLGELESMVRLAAENGIALDGTERIFAAYGRVTPDLGMTGPIDATDRATG